MANAFGRKPTCAKGVALVNDPSAKPVAVLLVAARHTGMAFSLDKALEVREAILPLGLTGFPDPAGKSLQAGDPSGWEMPRPMGHALRSRPRTKRVPILRM